MNKKIIGILIVVLFMVVIIIPGNIIGECIDDQLDQQQTQLDGWIGLSKYDAISAAQSFKPTLNELTRISLYIANGGLPGYVDTLTLSIRDTLDGSPLTSKSVNAIDLPGGIYWIEFDFPDIQVTPNQIYYIHCDSNFGEGNFAWGIGNYTPYNQGQGFYNYVNSTGWIGLGDRDWTFKTYGFDSGENNPPEATISYPQMNDEVSGTITIIGTAFDPDGDYDLKEIQVDTGSGFQKASGTTNWSYIWDTTEVEDGMHTIYAVAIDKEYESSTIESVTFNICNQNHPPMVDILFPEENDIVTGSINIYGMASDPDGNETLNCVEVKIDDKPWQNATGIDYWNYSWNTVNETEGNHTFKARSYDGELYSNISVVNVTVQHAQLEVIITAIDGGFGLSADIKNIGLASAFDVNWSITVEEDFAFIISGSHFENMIDEIGVGDSVKIQSNGLRGIGLITITVQAADAVKQATAFLLGPLVLRVNEI